MLLAENADCLAKDANGWTALHWAASKGNVPIAKMLLDHCSQIRARHKPIRIFVKDLTVERAKEVSKSLTEDDAIKSPLEITAEKEDMNTFGTILEDLASRASGQTLNDLWRQRGWDKPRLSIPWRVMSKSDHFDGKGLERWDIHKNRKSSMAWKNKLLHGAIRDGKLLIVQLLIELGADIRSPYEDRTPLQQAASLQDPEITKILLAKGAHELCTEEDSDPESQPPLHYAIACGFDRTMKALIDGGMDINVRNKRGQTPLMLACGTTARSEDSTLKSLPHTMARILIENGADVHLTDVSGSSALHVAAGLSRSDAQIVRLLLESGSDANAPNSENHTPFHVFCRDSHGWGNSEDPGAGEVLDLLLAHSPPGTENAVCQQKTWDRETDIVETPLAMAIDAENWSAFHLLLRKGAKLRTTRPPDDLLWKSAYHWALQPLAVEFLLEMGASVTAIRLYSAPMGHTALDGLLHEDSKAASRFEDFQSILNLYLKFGLDVNSVDCIDQSLLHVAVSGAQGIDESALTQYLLDVDADPYKPICGA